MILHKIMKLFNADQGTEVVRHQVWALLQIMNLPFNQLMLLS